MTPNKKPVTRKQTSVVRSIGPMVPLAIALLHGSMTNKPAPGLSAGSAGASVTQSQSTGSGALAGMHCGGGTADSPACSAPYPMLTKGHPVDWFFVFKLNGGKFPMCGGGDTRTCPFGGTVQTTPSYQSFGQQYVFASSEAPVLQGGGKDCLGTTTGDPVGATFDEIYEGNFHFVVWNDQFYGDPKSASCGGDGCSGTWGHSKGMVAWNEAGEGVVMQVSTPSWPGAGSAKTPRKDGNTLGCVADNDVKVSQHFFALRLTEPDLVQVLRGLANASVVTDAANAQIVNNGGPDEVQELVKVLGVKSKSVTSSMNTLSTGVRLISKPSNLHVPPWQMVSSLLGGISLRTATWWASPQIESTTAATKVGCWDSTLGRPGAVAIATTGQWSGTVFGLKGGPNSDANHAKVGVSTTENDHFAIFGDMNQQGTLSGTNCASSQNGRGGMFFVMDNEKLAGSITGLIAGSSAPTELAPK
jgi:hypothetical protein